MGMRFVELTPDSSRDCFELHPRITILQGLDPAARVAVVGFLHSIAGGDAFDWSGLAEVHGVVMTLDSALDIIGATAEAALIIEANSLLDIAVDPGDALTREGQAYREASGARQQIDSDITELAEELGGASRIRSEMQARHASASARLDNDAGRRLDLADGALGRAARLSDRPDPWTGMDDVPGRLSELEVLVDELDTQLSALASGDRSSLAAALATARSSVSKGPVPCPEAAALAAAWTSLHQRLVGLESRMEAAGGGTEAVAGRLDAARASARSAEDAAVPRSVLPDEATELAALHDRVLKLERRAGKSLRRGAARREFELAKGELNEALDELGYLTWAAFRMGNGMAMVSRERVAAYEKSLEDLEGAELEWTELMARLERDSDLQSVLDAIDVAAGRAVQLLGHDPMKDARSENPDLIAEALLAVRVDAGSVGAAPDDAFAHLRSVLGDCDAIGHQDLHSERALLALGETWLSVLASADTAAVRILRDRERAGAEQDALVLLGDVSRVDRLSAERTTVHEAEAEVAEVRKMLIEMNHIDLELHMLAANELTVAEEHDAKLQLRDGAEVLERLAEHQLRHSTGGPHGMASVISRIPRGRAGAIPLVVLMGGAPVTVLDALHGLPEDVQAIVIGDTPGIAEWVADQEHGTVKSIEVHAFV